MSLDFCCDIQMLGSEFGVKNMKAWIHPALSQQRQLVSRTWQWDSDTLLKWPPQSPYLNPIENLWDVVEREIYIMDVQPTNLQQLQIYHVNMNQNLWGLFPTLCWIYATKN